MRLTSIAACSVLLLGSLSGCIPAPYGAYYRPAYADASSRLTKAYCGGQAGPPAVLSFNGPEGLQLTISALRGYVDRKRDDWPLRIAISLPPGTQWQFLADHLSVSESATPTPAEQRALPVELQAGTSLTIDAHDWIDYAEQGPTDAAVAEAYLASHPQNALTEVSLPTQEFAHFTPSVVAVELPAIETPARTLVWPATDLHPIDSRSGTRIYRSPAYTEELLANQARCLARTPQLHCDYIVSADPYALKIASGGFTFKGSADIWDLAKPSPFRFNFELSSRSTVKWRLPEPAIRFRDIATGEVRAGAIKTLHIAWHVSVPLSTAIRATAAGMQPRTGLLIEASLGERHAPHYFINLPPMQINGHRYTLKPIELELRLLDGGIEPFNC